MKRSDIKKLSIDEIDKLIEQLKEERSIKEKKTNFIKVMIQQAKESGINIEDIKEELLNNKDKKNKRIKYRMIINGEEKTYSGVGKKPQWFIDYINKGGDLNLIKETQF